MKAEERARKATNANPADDYPMLRAVTQAIREAEQSAREEEREACEKVAKSVQEDCGDVIAAAIRARNGT